MSNNGEAGFIPAFEDYFAQFPDDRQPQLFMSGPVPQLARRVVKPGYRTHYVGYFSSRKNNCLIPFESAIERDACLLFEGSLNILRYSPQPAELTFTLDGRTRRTFPDFELICTDGQTYVEVKPESKTLTAAFRSRIAAIRTTGSLNGRSYLVLTDKDIRGEVLPQVAELYQHGRWKVPHRLTKMVLAWLTELNGEIRYGHAVKRLRDYSTARCALDGLILDGVLRLDFSIPLARQLLIPTPALLGDRQEVLS